MKPVSLANQHVRLEPLEERHRAALRDLAQEEELWALTSQRADGPHFDPWFDGMLAGQARGDQISHAVWSTAHAAFVGHSAYLAIVPDHSRVEIGWTWYARPFRGTVINPACKHLLFGRAFACGMERVELKTHGRNLRSQRAMEKLGAVREGVLRRHMLTWTGEHRDTVFYSVLKDEWPAVEAGLAARL